MLRGIAKTELPRSACIATFALDPPNTFLGTVRHLSFVTLFWFAFVSLHHASSQELGAQQPGVLEKTIRLGGFPKDEVPVVTSVAIHPTARLLATAGDDHLVRLWDLETGQIQRTLRGHGDWVTSVVFCADGRRLITGGRDRQLLMWDVTKKTPPRPVGTHRQPISGIALHPVTKLLAVSGFRAPLKVYDSTTRQLIDELRCPCLDTRALAFSPNGVWLAAGGRNGKLRIWNLRTREKFDLSGHKRRITSVVFASDKLLLSAGEEQQIHVWDIEGRSRKHSLSHQVGKVLAMTMVDNTRFAVATAQNVIAICDLRDPEPMGVLRGHTGSVAAIVSRDDRLVSGSFDTTIRIWKIFDPMQDNQAALVHPATVLE